MATNEHVRPGTTSKLLWHFTGGPRWSEHLGRHHKRRKPVAAAYEAFESILASRTLRRGAIDEAIPLDASVFGHPVRTENPTSKVCCLADIPIGHLQFHAEKYGRFAIGFHREAAIRAGFSPVWYSLDGSIAYRRLSALASSVSSLIIVSKTVAETGTVLPLPRPVGDDARQLMRSVAHVAEEIQSKTLDLASLMKSFTVDEFETIYSEREWRSLDDYSFDYDEIAMLVLPRLEGKRHPYTEFLRTSLARRRLPRSVPIVAWEDLIEH